MVALCFPKDEYEQRWAKALANIKKQGFDVAVVRSRSAGSYDRSGDVLYLTNFYSGHSAHEFDTPIWRARSYTAGIMQQGQEPELHTDEAGYPDDLLPASITGQAINVDHGEFLA